MIESLLYTSPLVIIAFVIKVIMMNNPSSGLYGQPLLTWQFSPLALLVYTISSLAQEFICRGFIQTNVEQMLTGKYRSEKDLSKSTRGEGVRKYLNEKGIDVLTSLDNVSIRHNATPAQVALA